MRKLLAVVGGVMLGAGLAACSSSQTVVDHPAGSSSLARVGDTLNLKTEAGHPFEITLTQVVDPARATSGSAGSGKRFVAVEFRIDNTSGQGISGNANADANVVGSNDQTYNTTHTTLRECGTNTSKIEPAAGKTVTSCVAFLMRTSVKVAQVQFSPAAGGANEYGQWQVS